MSEKKSLLPTWLSFSLAELRWLLNIVLPTPLLTRDYRLQCFWQRRDQRLRAIASRYQLPVERLRRLSLPP